MQQQSGVGQAPCSMSIVQSFSIAGSVDNCFSRWCVWLTVLIGACWQLQPSVQLQQFGSKHDGRHAVAAAGPASNKLAA
jgi:hypothetical protein